MLDELRKVVDELIEQSLEEIIKKVGTTEGSIMYIGEFSNEIRNTFLLLE